jgi:hypothetical protein
MVKERCRLRLGEIKLWPKQSTRKKAESNISAQQLLTLHDQLSEAVLQVTTET